MALTGQFLITGAASGIGAASARKIAGPNCMLILQTRSNIPGLEEIGEACRQKGAKVITLQQDLSDPEQTQALIDRVLTNASKLDGVISAAGFPDWRNFETLSSEQYMQSLQLMQHTNFALLQQLTNVLQKAQGSFIAISSFLAHKMQVGNSFTPASASAKAGMEALIQSYAAQYAAKGVRCNAIVPGYIKKDGVNHRAPSPDMLTQITNRIPAGRLGLPEEVAALAQFLLSANSRYITGQLIHIDGGLLLK